MKIIVIQNPEYDTASWSVSGEGKQKKNGQHFLISLTRKELPVLRANNMKVRVGILASTVMWDRNNAGILIEPDIGGIAESFEKASMSDDGNSKRVKDPQTQ